MSASQVEVLCSRVEDILAKSEARWAMCGANRISMIFQEPMTALNPPKKTVGGS